MAFVSLYCRFHQTIEHTIGQSPVIYHETIHHTLMKHTPLLSPQKTRLALRSGSIAEGQILRTTGNNFLQHISNQDQLLRKRQATHRARLTREEIHTSVRMGRGVVTPHPLPYPYPHPSPHCHKQPHSLSPLAFIRAIFFPCKMKQNRRERKGTNTV